ncbi:MAG: rhodanese-like domain-containing protein [Desulfobacterales bacterium]|nr:rhodanese-like domain-containing protein [Desulfobacterales bacterium]
MDKQIIGRALVLVLALLPLSLAVNHFSPVGIQWVGQWDTEQGVITARSKADAVLPEVEIDNPLEVRRIIRERQRLLIDVRLKDIYDQGHLPGALSFPLAEFDDNMGDFIKVASKDSPILLYCSGFTCSDSHTFAKRLREMGFTGVKVYGGGFEEWEEMGFDVEY